MTGHSDTDHLTAVRAALAHVDDIGPARGLVALRKFFSGGTRARLARSIVQVRGHILRVTIY